MPYIIEYTKEGQNLGSTPWAGSLEKTKQVAQDGLIRNGAVIARIIDDETRKIVATVSKS